MSQNWKYIITQILVGLLLTGVLLGAYFLGRKESQTICCKDIIVNVEDSTSNKLVTDETVRNILTSEYEGLIGKPIGEIDLMKVKDILSSEPTIQSCNVYISNEGYLNVTVSQRTPVVRFQSKDFVFYSDCEGYMIPLQKSFIADVPIIDGNIPVDTTACKIGQPAIKDVEWLNNIISMTKQINASPVWKDAVSQIHCNEKSDLVIITKIGNEKFVFGQPVDVESKLEKMQIYYEMIAPASEKDYDIVDLRFKEQIICKNNEQK